MVKVVGQGADSADERGDGQTARDPDLCIAAAAVLEASERPRSHGSGAWLKVVVYGWHCQPLVPSKARKMNWPGSNASEGPAGSTKASMVESLPRETTATM